MKKPHLVGTMHTTGPLNAIANITYVITCPNISASVPAHSYNHRCSDNIHVLNTIYANYKEDTE